MALLIAIERMKPLRPSSAPTMIRMLLSIANPVATAARPALRIQQRHDHRHVRTADRQDKEDPDEHGDRQHRGENPHFIWRDDQPTHADAGRGEQSPSRMGALPRPRSLGAGWRGGSNSHAPGCRE
jgi:hypothetical protein